MGGLKDHSWQRVYRDVSRTPLSFAVHPKDPNHWYLGTQKGLWETQDAGKIWLPSLVLRASGPVPLLIFDHDRLFLADGKNLYLAMPKSQARSVFELSKTTPEPAPTDSDDSQVLEEDLVSYDLKIRDLIASKRDPQEIFRATKNGVFGSHDGGNRWEPLSRSGLQSASDAKGLSAISLEKINDFRDLHVWKLGKELVVDVYKATKNFPQEELYGLTTEMRRAAISIPSNISEGYNRRYTKDYQRFLSFALGSCAEVETQIEVCRDLGYFTSDACDLLLEKIDHETRMIRSLMNKL